MVVGHVLLPAVHLSLGSTTRGLPERRCVHLSTSSARCSSTWYLLLGMPLFFDVAYSSRRVLALDAWILFFFLLRLCANDKYTSHVTHLRTSRPAPMVSSVIKINDAPYILCAILHPPTSRHTRPRPPCQATRHVVDIGTRHASPLPQFITLSSVHAAREGLSQLATGAGSQGLASVAQTTHHP